MAPPAPLVKRETLQSVAAQNHRSIIRTTRPPSLDLEIRNGSTRWNSPIPPQTAPAYHRHRSPRGYQSEPPRYSPVTEEPSTASTTDLPIMGTSGSKDNAQSDDPHQPSRRKHLIFRRHSKSPAPRPPTFTFPPPEIASKTGDDGEHAQPVNEEPSQDSHESSNPTSTAQEAESQQPSIQTLPSTPPYDAAEEQDKSKHRTPTPVLRLPTPSLMTEESPGKYGMSAESTPLRNEPFVPRPRPKSGTGVQLFKVRLSFSCIHGPPSPQLFFLAFTYAIRLLTFPFRMHAPCKQPLRASATFPNIRPNAHFPAVVLGKIRLLSPPSLRLAASILTSRRIRDSPRIIRCPVRRLCQLRPRR